MGIKALLTHTKTTLTVLALLASLLLPPVTTQAAPAPSTVPGFVTTWGSYASARYGSPNGITVDATGDTYIVDTDNSRVLKLNSEGSLVTQWGSEGSGNGQFSYPQGIAIDSVGNVYVADGNNRIQKFDADGTFISQWGSYGSGNGEFMGPRGIAKDSDDNIYVVDNDNHRIQKFDADGTFISQWGSYGSGNGQLSSPSGITIDSVGNVYVADTSNHRIQKFDSNGTYITKWGTSGSGNGQFSFPIGITIDSSGYVYIADPSNNRIQKFDTNGTYITKWTSTGAYGVHADPAGNVYVLRLNGEVKKYDSSGTLLTQWGSYGTDDGQFNGDYDMTSTVEGELFVLEYYNNRIQKFSYPPETATLSSTESGANIALESTAFTTFSCSTSVTEDSLTTSDTTQDYPLGLVDFCLDVVPGSTNTVSLTFETDLTADQVIARKYNPTTQTYTDVPGATITATTLDGNPALILTYDITDGGDLDDDGLANGTILDPVGLAIDAAATTSNTSDADTLADTGSKLVNAYVLIAALVSLALVVFVIHKRRFV